MVGVRGVDYVAEVAPGIFRGGTPDAEGVAWLKEIGVRTVINLRHFHGSREQRLVEAAGVRYVRIKLASSGAPAATSVRELFDLLDDPVHRPIYIHCKHGVDRTGAMMAVYRMELQGWTNAEAIAEMEHFGAHVIWRDLKRFVRTYVPSGRWRRPRP